jgi:hypothetical protein
MSNKVFFMNEKKIVFNKHSIFMGKRSVYRKTTLIHEVILYLNEEKKNLCSSDE